MISTPVTPGSRWIDTVLIAGLMSGRRRQAVPIHAYHRSGGVRPPKVGDPTDQ
jgi:hypothetical protein